MRGDRRPPYRRKGLTLPGPGESDWRTRAACRGLDPELFYPEAGGAGPALRVCRECPVRERCLRVALDSRDDWGVWGGMTGSQRLAYRKCQTPDVA